MPPLYGVDSLGQISYIQVFVWELEVHDEAFTFTFLFFILRVEKCML